MKAYYVNRQDREDRHYLFRGAMANAGFAHTDLVRHIAKNKEDYPNREALCEAASDDGFPEFFGYQRDQKWPGYGHLVCSWSVMRCWREIAESGETAIQLLDDYYIRDKYRLEMLLGALGAAGEVDILQLAWHKREDVFFLNEYDLPIEYAIEDLEVSNRHIDVYTGAPQGCSDWANVLSPTGAQRILDFMKYNPFLNTECVLTGLHHTFRDTPNFFSVRDNDPTENGTIVLQNNGWIGHLVEYTEGNMSDLAGTHENPNS